MPIHSEAMIPLRSSLLAALVLVCVSGTSNARGPYGSIQVGQWRGGAFTNDATGAFSHCSAGAFYKSGIYFMVAANATGGWELGFVHQAWQLTPGQTIPVDLTFDSREQFHVFANPINAHQVVVPMPVDSQLIFAFRKARQMSAFANGNLFVFDLTDTSRLLPALVECVTEGRRGVGTVGVIGPRPAVVAPQVATTSPAPPPANAPESSNLEVEAIQLATNFILNAKLHDPHVLAPSETPVQFASFGAEWKADEGIGTVKIVTGNNLKGLDVAAAVAAADSESCGGKFASGRVSELVDSDVVFRGFSSCQDSNGTRAVQYFIVPRPAGGFVIFSLTGNAVAGQAASTAIPNEDLATFRKAALVSVEK